MRRRENRSMTSAAVAALAAAGLLAMAGVTLSPAPANAVVYCQYIDYPPSCVARAGVVLRPRPVARAAVRAGTASATNLNGRQPGRCTPVATSSRYHSTPAQRRPNTGGLVFTADQPKK
jgi:hypothetical protein